MRGSDLRRRIEALETSLPEVVRSGDIGASKAFTDFIAETFGTDSLPLAEHAAHLFGLPSASVFRRWLVERFTADAHEMLAREAYGTEWRAEVERVSDEPSARCRALHGDDWEHVLIARMDAVRPIEVLR